MRTSYQERRALGCRVQLALVTEDAEEAEQWLRKLWLELLYFEKRCSRFLPDSELSRFNKAAGSRQFISPELRAVLLAAREMATRTQGIYNPFILPAVQRAGYVHSLEEGRGDDAVDDFSGRQVVAAERLQIGDDWAEIPYGTAIDLGGCGKGYIGDRLAELAESNEQIRGYWFSVGGDVVAGGLDEQGSPWVVYLQPDPKGGPRIGEVAAEDGRRMAVATSTTRFRKGEGKSGTWHHIVDPRVGKVAESDIDLATVRADSLLAADVLATCAIIVGSAKIEELVSAQTGVVSAAWQANVKAPLHVWGNMITAYPTDRDARRQKTFG